MGSRTGLSDEQEPQPDELRRKGVVRDYTETILICVLVLIFVRTFVFQQSDIPSGSMEDTILVGDTILVNRFLFSPTGSDLGRRLLPTREVRRGDVIVFKHPDTPEVEYIKRVVGIPGDRVLVRDGYVYVNGEAVDEPFVGPLYRAPEPNGRPFGPVLVRPGHYFVMGDHRNSSSDSRVWGQVPHALIKGRAFMILFSTSGRPPAGQDASQVTPASFLKKLFNLVFRARWDRAFTAIR